MDTLPRVKSVTASKKDWSVKIVWADNRKSHVDLTELIHRSKHFRVFIDNEKALQKVAPINFGSGIGWEKWSRLQRSHAPDTRRRATTNERLGFKRL